MGEKVVKIFAKQEIDFMNDFMNTLSCVKWYSNTHSYIKQHNTS